MLSHCLQICPSYCAVAPAVLLADFNFLMMGFAPFSPSPLHMCALPCNEPYSMLRSALRLLALDLHCNVSSNCDCLDLALHPILHLILKSPLCLASAVAPSCARVCSSFRLCFVYAFSPEPPLRFNPSPHLLNCVVFSICESAGLSGFPSALFRAS